MALSDDELIERAAKVLGSQKALAERFQLSEAAVSQWKKQGISRHLRKTIERIAGGDTTDEPADEDRPIWLYRGWQDHRRYTACIEQLGRVATDPRKLRFVEAVLNYLTDWTEDDWRKLYERKTDYWARDVLSRIKSEEKAAK